MSTEQQSIKRSGAPPRTDSRLWHPFAAMGEVRSSELVISRGDDVWVWDDQDRRYLDGTASLWYSNVGHGRPEIAAAIQRQLGKIEAYSAFGDLATEPALELATRLADLAPMEQARVFFGSGGADAVDTALKLSRLYWNELGQPERRHVISRANGYHGTHGFGTSVAGIPVNRVGFGDLIGDTSVVARDSVDALAAEIARIGADRIAAFIFEPVIGAGGVYPPLDGYVEGVADLCADAGILLIADSTICAFGRLGDWYGVERWDISPDMIIFAKGVTSGYLPLGGLVVSDRVAAPFWAPGAAPFRQGTTYSGHSTCCAAGLATLDLYESEGLLERGATLEHELMLVLASFRDHPLVADVRGGIGLLAAVELKPEVLDSQPGAVIELARLVREAGVLVRPMASAIAVSPPLTVTLGHLEVLADGIQSGLDALAVRLMSTSSGAHDGRRSTGGTT